MKIVNIKQNRFLMITKLKELIFHVGDFGRIWGISNRNNLRTTLKRYVDAGLIYRLYRGLYSLNKAEELNPSALGAKAIDNYCYLSCESVLAQQGIIFQKINYFTFVGSQTKRFKIASYEYYCHQLKDEFLYNDLGIIKNENFNMATLERAVADLLYFNPRYHFDNSAGIDWEKVKKIQQTVYNKNI